MFQVVSYIFTVRSSCCPQWLLLCGEGGGWVCAFCLMGKNLNCLKAGEQQKWFLCALPSPGGHVFNTFPSYGNNYAHCLLCKADLELGCSCSLWVALPGAMFHKCKHIYHLALFHVTQANGGLCCPACAPISTSFPIFTMTLAWVTGS